MPPVLNFGGNMKNTSTIAAISTAFVNAAIGVVRLSGPESISIADRVFKTKRVKSLHEASPNTAIYGLITDAEGELIDSCICTIFREPHSYTGEDMVEFSCHGNTIVLTRVLERLIECGASPAGRGEFTKRAFLNGKMDLSQSEAVIDIINAKSTLGAKEAFMQSSGTLRNRINDIRNKLLDIDSAVMAYVDFAAEGIEEPNTENIIKKTDDVRCKIEKLISSYNTGIVIKEGIPAVICGKPNVGKSSLMNMLSGLEKSIVTEYAGTTRDIIRDYVQIDGILFNISDTAGIRETEDKIEKIGVERAKAAAERSEIMLCVFDGSQPLDQNDFTIIDLSKDKKAIAIINKSDLPQALDVNILNKNFSEIVSISAKTGEGADILTKKIKELALNDVVFDFNEPLIINLRHRDALRHALEALDRVKEGLLSGLPAEVCELDIRETLSHLGEITGDTVTDDLIDRIFENFCVGK